MHRRTVLQCALAVLLMTGRIAATNGSQGNQQHGGEYNQGTACQFIYASLKYVCNQAAGITTIPSPCCISQVRYLEITGNPVTSLRKREFSRRFANLHEMDLRNNQIHRIHQGAFTGLKRLQVLDLSGNRLTSLPDKVFKGLSSLTTLHLGGNEIISMHQGAFSGLPSLTVLRLDHNNLQVTKEEVFEPLQRLRNLYLDVNQLSRLEVDSFSGLTQLRTLSLASNQLKSIPDFLSELPELAELILNNNPLVCDCRLAFLRRWLGEHTGRQSGDRVLCTSPPRFRGVRLTSIGSSALCRLGQRQPSGGGPSQGFPRYDQSFSSYQDQGGWIPGGDSYPGIGGTSSHPGTTTPDSTSRSTLATASKMTHHGFFDDIPVSDQPHHPGYGLPKATLTPVLVTRPNLIPGRPGRVTPNPRPTRPLGIPGGRPTTNEPNPSGPEFDPGPPIDRPPGHPPTGPTSGYGWTAQGTNHPVGAHPNPGVNGQPTISSGKPNSNPNGSSSFPNGTTGSSNYPNDPPSHPFDSELTTQAPGTGSPSILTDSVVVIDPSGDTGVEGESSTGNGTQSSPLVVYGVNGHSVVLLCGNEELESKPRVKWLLPNGRPITGLNSRFKVEVDGSLRIRPLRRSDAGSYRCILRSLTSSKVILVRLRAACPCRESTSSEDDAFYDDFPPETYPVPVHACSWTPLVIAVVTTFQGTVAACALAFCIWYTRCHRRKNFTIRVDEAEKQDSRRLRNSDMSVLRDCPNSTIASLTDSSRSTSYEQGSLRPCDSVSGVSARTRHTLSDYMNAYATQQVRRQQFPLRVPVPDYVDLDPNSRDSHETLYSSLRGRDFINRRRRIVTH